MKESEEVPEGFKVMPEISGGRCLGCAFSWGRDAHYCGDFECAGRIAIPDTPEGGQEYILERTRVKLGVKNDKI